MNRQTLKLMDNDHLIAALRAEQSPFTSTDAELELFDRFEKLLDQSEEVATLREFLDEYNVNDVEGITRLRELFDAHPANLVDMAKLLSFLNDQEINDLDDLAPIKAVLEALPAEPSEIAEMLSFLRDESIDNLADLKEIFKKAEETELV